MTDSPIKNVDLTKCPLTEDEKEQMVAEKAFLKSEERGFASNPPKDWLEAESELEDALAKDCQSAGSDQKPPPSQRIRANVRQFLGSRKESISPTTIRQALQKGGVQLRQWRAFFAGEIDRDLQKSKQAYPGTIRKWGRRWEHFRTMPHDLFSHLKASGPRTLNRKMKSFYTKIHKKRNSGEN